MATGVSELELLVGEVATPLGPLTLVASPRGVVATAFDDEDPDTTVAGIEAKLGARARSAQRRLSTVRREVEDYFEGRIRTFATAPDLALAPRVSGGACSKSPRRSPTANCGPTAMSPRWPGVPVAVAPPVPP